jgi:plasmid stabilization system protein ParE
VRVRFLVPARRDLADATAYYEDQMPDLGVQFLDEVWAAIDRIRAFPLAWQPLSQRTRRCLLNRFPYGVIYEQRKDEIVIVAVGHQHRHPDFWKPRAE